MSLLATLALMLSPVPAVADDLPRDDRPVTLAIIESDADVLVRVIGRSREVLEARYTLEVSSGTGQGNRSVQSGRARLLPDAEVGLITLRLGGAARTGWAVTLRVDTDRGSYEISKRAA